MLELSAILSAYLCFALLHAAIPDRLPEPLAGAVSAFEAWRVGTRLSAALFFGLSSFLWSLAAAGPVVWVGPILAWILSGVLIVLLRPVAERIVWGVAVLCPPVIVALAVIGGVYAG